MIKNYTYVAISSELAHPEHVNAIVNKHERVLKTTGGDITEFNKALSAPILIYFILTGGTEQKFLDIHRERSKHYPNEPVYLLAHANNNSLPAALEILARIRQEKTKGKIIYLSGNEENDINLINNSIRNLKVYNKLLSSRMGLFGKPSDWLIASAPEAKQVKETWGIDVLEYRIDEIIKIYNALKGKDYDEHIKKFTSNANSINEPSEEEIRNSVKVYSSIKELSLKNNLTAISVRCFDLLTDEKTTGCYALSKLTDEGIIAGCEGDVVSSIGMLWVYEMFKKTPWMSNPSRMDINENRLILAHCTVPINIVSEYGIRSHFESGIGVGIQGKITNGPITLLRLGGTDLKSIWLAEGEIIKNVNEANLCRTQVEIRLHDRNKLKELLTNPLGNHIILVHGFHAEELEDWHNEFIV